MGLRRGRTDLATRLHTRRRIRDRDNGPVVRAPGGLPGPGGAEGVRRVDVGELVRVQTRVSGSLSPRGTDSGGGGSVRGPCRRESAAAVVRRPGAVEKASNVGRAPVSASVGAGDSGPSSGPGPSGRRRRDGVVAAGDAASAETPFVRPPTRGGSASAPSPGSCDIVVPAPGDGPGPYVPRSRAKVSGTLSVPLGRAAASASCRRWPRRRTGEADPSTSPTTCSRTGDRTSARSDSTSDEIAGAGPGRAGGDGAGAGSVDAGDAGRAGSSGADDASVARARRAGSRRSRARVSRA